MVGTGSEWVGRVVHGVDKTRVGLLKRLRLFSIIGDGAAGVCNCRFALHLRKASVIMTREVMMMAVRTTTHESVSRRT